MANANGSGDLRREDNQDRKAVGAWSSVSQSSGPLLVANRKARRMTGRPKQPNRKPTTASRNNGCWPFAVLAPVVAVLVGWAVR